MAEAPRRARAPKPRDEAFEHQAFLLEQELNFIEPLDKPVAKSVTLIIPSAEDIGAQLLATDPNVTQDDLDFLAKRQYNIFAIVERQIARSNRFERVESVIQDEDARNIELPPGGYGRPVMMPAQRPALWAAGRGR